ncbi:hypothetical protein [Actinophytocola sp. NPDC049390]|uniref:hypothetical protein n=1 Tax=Actinophytocola sp. NPDC049390 TaxID=3363894 RepID=UPI0037B92247
MMPTALDTEKRPALRIRPTRDVAGQLGRYVSAIVAKVRAAYDTGEPGELVIDLSHAATVPQAQLILLLNLLRPIVGNDTRITLSGMRPMNLGSLVGYDLPDNVVVVDTRGRRWTTAG